MNQTELKIGDIPAILWNQNAERLFLYIHGQNGCKEEAKIFAEAVSPLEYAVLSIDLPRHGERKNSPAEFAPWSVVPELRYVMEYARSRYKSISLFANSIGAWFSMLAFSNEPLEKCLFLSPVTDMNRLIERMMTWAGVSPELLEQKGEIPTDFGQTLSHRYRQFALEHTITDWNAPTFVLYGSADNLIERETIERFCQQFCCNLTILQDGEHWFHTDEQISFMLRWVKSSLK